MNKHDSDVSISILDKLHHEALLRGFAAKCNVNYNDLSVEYWSTRRKLDNHWYYEPTIMIYGLDHTPLSIMSLKIAYRYVNIGNLILTINQVMNSVGWD